MPQRSHTQIAVTIFLLALAGCRAAWCDLDQADPRTAAIPNMQIYKKASIVDRVRLLGYDEHLFPSIKRNSTGSTLYLFVRERPPSQKRVVLSISDGRVTRLDAPSDDSVYLNDRGQFAAWRDMQSPQVIHFRNGTTRVSEAFFGVDPAGEVFFISVKGGMTDVARIEEPQNALFQTGLIGPRQIFSKGERIYLFGSDIRTGNEKYDIVLQVWLKKEKKYTLEKETHIARPIPDSTSLFSVTDMDPWSETVLLANGTYAFNLQMGPTVVWFTYDLATGKTVEVGSHNGFVGLFLKKDVLQRDEK